MKAPNKIYIGIQEDGFIDCGIQQTSTCPNEYICKDILLEWAKETYLNENASAIRKVCFKQLVEKLISM